MTSKETKKNQVKFYTDLTEKERTGIVYLPDIQKPSLKTLSSNSPQRVSEKKAKPLLFAQFHHQSSLSAKASSLEGSHGWMLSGTGKSHFSGTDDTSSPIKTSVNRDKPYQKGKSLSGAGSQNTTPLSFDKNKKENIVYLQNHSEKKAMKQSPPYKKNPTQIIPFPFPKAPPFMRKGFAYAKLQNAVMAAMACLLVVLGGKAVISGVDNISRTMSGSIRGLAEASLLPPKPSEIIENIQQKEITVAKTIAFQTRQVASSESPKSSKLSEKSSTSSAN